MINFKQLSPEHFSDVIQFADKEIGLNYFNEKDLKEIYEQSLSTSGCSSYLAFDQDKLIAIRLTRNHGTGWHKKKQTDSNSWKVAENHVAYFQSLFIAESHQGKGLGVTLSQMSIKELKRSGAKAIVSHSHVESPNNSSYKYLKKIGFEDIKRFNHYWKEIDYFCSACKKDNCICSALEMILYL